MSDSKAVFVIFYDSVGIRIRNLNFKSSFIEYFKFGIETNAIQSRSIDLYSIVGTVKWKFSYGFS